MSIVVKPRGEVLVTGRGQEGDVWGAVAVSFLDLCAGYRDGFS